MTTVSYDYKARGHKKILTLMKAVTVLLFCMLAIASASISSRSSSTQTVDRAAIPEAAVCDLTMADQCLPAMDAMTVSNAFPPHGLSLDDSTKSFGGQFLATFAEDLERSLLMAMCLIGLVGSVSVVIVLAALEIICLLLYLAWTSTRDLYAALP